MQVDCANSPPQADKAGTSEQHHIPAVPALSWHRWDVTLLNLSELRCKLGRTVFRRA